MWSDIYILLRVAAIDSEPRYVQYKILHNMLYLNKNLFIFGKTDTKLCSFCKLEGETPFELFANCTKLISFGLQRLYRVP